jgi:hypothetical protein
LPPSSIQLFDGWWQFHILEEYMRIENPLVSQSLIESPKTVENKTIVSGKSLRDESVENELSSILFSVGSSAVYSPGSLRAAVDYHAKLLTVAENNMEAVNHSSTIPRELLDRFNAR